MLDYRIYLVTDDPSRYAGDWLDNVTAAVAGGVTCVQYRDTESAPDVAFARARRLRDALRARRIPLVVNNDAELAAALGAEGVHVGQGDLAPEAVRKIVGRKCEVGLSLTASGQVDAACARFAAGTIDCVGIGPVFDATRTKADASAALGCAGLKTILAALGAHPNCAIGGITCANAAEVCATGVGGLALVSAFSKAADPCAVARELARRIF